MSQEVHLWGWDKDAEKWVKCLVDEFGKLIIDPTDIFESTPTQHEHGKAPDSAWAYDHKESPSAHHAKYTDGEAQAVADTQIGIHALLPSIHHVKFTAAEARAAINNIFGPDGKADVDINLDTHKLINVVDPVADQDADTKKARETALTTHAGLATVHQDAPGLILTHKGDASAHHSRYTDLAARASINHVHTSTGKITQHLDVNTHRMINVVDPVNDQDTATKKYVDDHVPSGFCKIKTGTYTGDGTTSHAITGVGFQPKFVLINMSGGDDDNIELFFRMEGFIGDLAIKLAFNELQVRDNKIISLDEDGFTVDDDGLDYPPNKNEDPYNYLALG